MFVTRILVGLLMITGIAAFAVPQPALPTQPDLTDPGASAAVLMQGATDTPTPLPPTAVPTAIPAPPDVVIWWPAEIMPDVGTPEEESILSLLDDYRTAYDQSVMLRVKRLTGTGSILSTLKTAQTVAPLALPDLVLLDRATLVEAAATDLVAPLDGTTVTSLTSNLFTRASVLGRFDETTYGIPYTLTVQHAAYAENIFDDAPNTQREILDSGAPFAFAVGHDTGVSDALLIQYFAAGGRTVDSDGNPVLDEAALATVLEFYGSALDAGQIDTTMLDTTNPDDTWNALTSGTASVAQVDSNTYLKVRAQHPGIVPIILPTESGSAFTTLDGWIWAVTTPDPARQARALELVTWAMQVENQLNITDTLNVLPSQRVTLQLSADTTYTALIDRLLSNSQAVLPEQVSHATATALQEALVSVLTGEESAADAAAIAANQINS